MGSEITHVYADGGLLGPNAKETGCVTGGVYAWRHVCQEHLVPDVVIAEGSGYLSPSAFFPLGLAHCTVIPRPGISSNLAELVAILAGLEALPDGWSGTVASDSHFVLLYWLFGKGTWATVPREQAERTARQLERLGPLIPLHLSGHPTQYELTAGFSKKGRPVSEHNVWCDDRCQQLRQSYFDTVRARTQGKHEQEGIGAYNANGIRFLKEKDKIAFKEGDKT
jgi:hypothetical protein